MIFLGHVLSADRIYAIPEKVGKVRDSPVPKNSKELHSFLGLVSIIIGLSQTLLLWPNVYTN